MSSWDWSGLGVTIWSTFNFCQTTLLLTKRNFSNIIIFTREVISRLRTIEPMMWARQKDGFLPMLVPAKTTLPTILKKQFIRTNILQYQPECRNMVLLRRTLRHHHADVQVTSCFPPLADFLRSEASLFHRLHCCTAFTKVNFKKMARRHDTTCLGCGTPKGLERRRSSPDPSLGGWRTIRFSSTYHFLDLCSCKVWLLLIFLKGRLLI